MKVLIISEEVWRHDTNGGNVLSNIFDGSGFEFSQIYCSSGNPSNHLCRRYFQITDGMVLRNFARHRPVGKAFGILDDSSTSNLGEMPNKSFYSFFRTFRWNIFYICKEIIWSLSNWKNEALKAFVDEFAPDIIFAPCYGNLFMLKLTRFIAEYTKKPIISYISDDHYTLKQFSLSPFYWARRFVLRTAVKKTFSYYSLVYTMTEEQKKQCTEDFNANIKVLKKAAKAPDISSKSQIQQPIKLIFAGGIYLNRWKTLSVLSRKISKINAECGNAFRLDIYAGSNITKKMRKSLDNQKHTFLHESLSAEQLEKEYGNSDIALHVEGFDIKNRLAVRYSFSTKIVDCLSSGCAVVAICDAKQAGLKYLKKEDAAICIDSLSDVERQLRELMNRPEIITEYSRKASDCLLRNHNKETLRNTIISDFNSI